MIVVYWAHCSDRILGMTLLGILLVLARTPAFFHLFKSDLTLDNLNFIVGVRVTLLFKLDEYN